jgi:putative flippase GtrA
MKHAVVQIYLKIKFFILILGLPHPFFFDFFASRKERKEDRLHYFKRFVFCNLQSLGGVIPHYCIVLQQLFTLTTPSGHKGIIASAFYIVIYYYAVMGRYPR